MSYIHLQLWGKFYNIWSVQQPLNLSDPDLNSLPKFSAIFHHKSEGFICRLAQLSRIIWMCRTKAKMVSPDCKWLPMMVMGWSRSLNKHPSNRLRFSLIDRLLNMFLYNKEMGVKMVYIFCFICMYKKNLFTRHRLDLLYSKTSL